MNTKNLFKIGFLSALTVCISALRVNAADDATLGGWVFNFETNWSQNTGEYEDEMAGNVQTDVEVDGDLLGYRLRLQKRIRNTDVGISIGYASGDFDSTISRDNGAVSDKDYEREIYDIRVELDFGWGGFENKLSSYLFGGFRYETQDGDQVLKNGWFWTGNGSDTRDEEMKIFTGIIGAGATYALFAKGNFNTDLRLEAYGLWGFAEFDTSDGWYDGAEDNAFGAGGNGQIIFTYTVEKNEYAVYPFVAVGYQAEWIGFGEEVGMGDLFSRGMYARAGLSVVW